MQNINVNIVPDNYPQTINFSQGDIGRQFKINVTDFEIPVGATVKIQATKPSGFGFSVAGTVSDNSVTFTTTEEMTDEAGRFQAELQITAGGDVIGTANFLMVGERNPHPEGTTDGSQGTIIPELTLLVERVEKAASDVLDMEVVATTLPAGSQASYSYDEALNKATFGIPEGQAGAGAAGVVASAYSAAKTYKVGDYVLYNSNLYRCTTAITTAEAWTAAHWTQVVLADDVSDLKTDLDGVAESLNKKLTFPNVADKAYFSGWRFPCLYLNDMPENLTSRTADKSEESSNTVKASFPLYNLNDVVLSKVKVQGSSSATFPKKNYTLTFPSAVKINPSWGLQKKYVIKANFNDASQVRNITSAKLWGQERKTRIVADANQLVNNNSDYLVNDNNDILSGETNKQLSIGINCGAIDGFPICVFINGEYWGLYSFTLPKDASMARMGYGSYECIVSADRPYNEATYFKHLATMEETEEGYLDFDVEYASSGFSRSDILSSVNTLITSAMGEHSTKEEYREAISPYLDIDSAIDYMIFCAITNNTDGIGRNYLLQTWNGVKWFFCAYDLDMVFGNDDFRGVTFGLPNSGMTFLKLSELHRMFYIIYHYFKDELIARYEALRNTAFSEANIFVMFGTNESSIPLSAYEYEGLIWAETPRTATSGGTFISEWARLRFDMLDKEIQSL